MANEPAIAFTPSRQTADADARLPEFTALAAPTTGAVVNRTQPPSNRADAVLATLPAAVFSELKVDQTLQLLRSEELLRRFDDLKHQMKDLGEEQRRVMASSLAITSGLSIGYVVWLVRGGVLVSSMLSALPAWQLIDPMPVLAAAGAVKKRMRGGAGAAKRGGERDVEELFDGQAARGQAADAARVRTGSPASKAVHDEVSESAAAPLESRPPGARAGRTDRRRGAVGGLDRPDPRRRGDGARAPFVAAESMALLTSMLLDEEEPLALRETLELVRKRAPDLHSIGVRSSAGTLLVDINGHAERWTAGERTRSTDAELVVPLWQDGAAWGHVELRFEPLRPAGWIGHLQDPSLRLSGFVFALCCVLFLGYLRRMLRELDPSRAVPQRVRAAYDTLPRACSCSTTAARSCSPTSRPACCWAWTSSKLVGGVPSVFRLEPPRRQRRWRTTSCRGSAR